MQSHPPQKNQFERDFVHSVFIYLPELFFAVAVDNVVISREQAFASSSRTGLSLHQTVTE